MPKHQLTSLGCQWNRCWPQRPKVELDPGEGEADQEGHQDDAADHRVARRIAHHRPAALLRPADAAHPAFPHHQQDAQRRHQGESGGGQQGNLEPDRAGGRLGQHAADEGPEDEADIVGGAELRHLAGALVLWSHIREVALHHRVVPGRHAARHADQERHVDVGREGQGAVAGAIGQQRRDQDRLAADAVRQPAPERLAKEGAHRIGGEDQGDLPGRGVERLAIERQQRHHDAKAHGVDEHHRQQAVERRGRPAWARAVAPLGRGGCRICLGHERRAFSPARARARASVGRAPFA